MNTPNQQSEIPANQNIQNDDEIDLLDILQFFVSNWKKMIMGSLLGLAMGLSWWSALAPFKAEVVISNSNLFNYTNWRALAEGLPNLAADLLSKDQVKPEQKALFENLKSDDWWKKNIIPTYVLTKSDTKELAFIPQSMQDNIGASILNIIIASENKDKAKAIENAENTVGFIKTGGAYLSLVNYLKDLRQNVLTITSVAEESINSIKHELKYKDIEVKKLLALRERFPQNTVGANQQVVDPKDSGAKYLPINTQLIAVNTDIINQNEELERYEGKLKSIAMSKTFLDLADPLLKGNYDGLLLIDKMLAIEKELRKQTDKNDIEEIIALTNIHSKLIAQKNLFDLGLSNTIGINVTKKSFLMPAALGGIMGLILTLFFVLLIDAIRKLKLR